PRRGGKRHKAEPKAPSPRSGPKLYPNSAATFAYVPPGGSTSLISVPAASNVTTRIMQERIQEPGVSNQKREIRNEKLGTGNAGGKRRSAPSLWLDCPF